MKVRLGELSRGPPLAVQVKVTFVPSPTSWLSGSPVTAGTECYSTIIISRCVSDRSICKYICISIVTNTVHMSMSYQLLS